ncbi:ABC transporter ATP-binding protein [Parvularcula marina]|nr:ABC transporter ATP-binding protein [Parvularcula marina]
MTDAAIEAQGLVRTYGAKRALDGVDLTIPAAGGITAILGPNGAGKTTFVSCALGLVPLSKGRLRIFGGKPGTLANKRRIGAMLQDSDLPALLTAREHITLFSSYYPNPMGTEELLELCEITPFADKLYKKLSGGQKRRVQFALAVVGQPELIFLDEPTTGLDIDARRVLWKTIRRLTETGSSVILTTHYLEEADALADRIIVFNEGQVIADAPTDEIRNAVGGAVIQCVTGISEADILAMPAVLSVGQSGRFTDIMSSDAPATLRVLLAADPSLTDLTVKKPTLEDAFLDLTRPKGEAA